MVLQNFKQVGEKTPNTWATSTNYINNGTNPEINDQNNDIDIRRTYNEAKNVGTSKDTFKLIKRIALIVNISGVILSGSLLINRASICLTK